MTDIVIVGAKRTPIGSMLGQFTGVPTPTLGATAITAALEHAGVTPDLVDDDLALVGDQQPIDVRMQELVVEGHRAINWRVR